MDLMEDPRLLKLVRPVSLSLLMDLRSLLTVSPIGTRFQMAAEPCIAMVVSTVLQPI